MRVIADHNLIMAFIDDDPSDPEEDSKVIARWSQWLDLPGGEDVAYIPLRGKRGEGLYAAVSKEDEERVLKYKWNVHPHGYAQCHINSATVTRMHQLILGKSSDGNMIDHIDGNRLNNTRNNLRVVTAGQNAQNRHARVPQSGYIGVVKSGKKWLARSGGIHIGSYQDPRAAGIAYDSFVYAKYGPGAKTNRLVEYDSSITVNDALKDNRQKLPRGIRYNEDKNRYEIWTLRRRVASRTDLSSAVSCLNEVRRIIHNYNEQQHQNKPIEVNVYNQPVIVCNDYTEVLVDKECWRKLDRVSWHIHSAGYVVCHKFGYMHHFVMGLHGVDVKTELNKGLVVDHINGCKTDNRYSNLRFNTQSGNAHNRRKAQNCSSKFIGVNRYSRGWRTTLRDKHIGCFKCELEAAAAYNIAATQLYGHGANLNHGIDQLYYESVRPLVEAKMHKK